MGNATSQKSVQTADNVSSQSSTQLMKNLADKPKKKQYHVGGLAGHHVAANSMTGIKANTNCACKAVYK